MGKKTKEGLGRSLIKDRSSKNRHKKHVEDQTLLHTTEVNDGFDWGRLNLQSVTAESSLQEFLSIAELAHREFTAEKLGIKYVKSAPSGVDPVTSQPDFDKPLTVPRRPPWHPGILPEDQLSNERESFLEWRRYLNELQAKLGAAVTPYERNLELWKQLWRTLEKSDVVLLLLDARNPLLFRCTDLEKYATENSCKIILLLNKADLTSEYQRKCWAEYFSKENVQVIFFSAAKDAKVPRISESNEEKSNKTNSGSDEEDSAVESDTDIESESSIKESDETNHTNDDNDLRDTKDDIEVFKKHLARLDEAVNKTSCKLDSIQLALDTVLENLKLGKPIDLSEFKSSQSANETSDAEPNKFIESCNSDGQDFEQSKIENLYSKDSRIPNSYEVFDREKLLEVLRSLDIKRLKNPPKLTVGMIGYPNVGKSSTVNVLMQTKKVSVSSSPGHTRHIQSLLLDDKLEILDCPGLVLPAYAVAPDLLLTAVLPIDQMRAHDAAMARLCQLVSKRTFEHKYGLLLPQDDNSAPLSHTQILTAHAFNRGFMSVAGQPDQSRSARLLLKDAASGRLRWEQLPPHCEPQIEDLVASEVNERRKPTPREARDVHGWVNKSAEVDKAFFAMNKSTAHVQGRPIIGIVGAQPARSMEPGAKPWKQEKRHANKNKREKLRRVYAHLDQH